MRLFICAVFAAVVLASGAEAATDTVLHSFCKLQGCGDGGTPQSRLVRDSAGNFYGTAASGAGQRGVVYQLSQRPGGHWRYRVLYNFCNFASCTDGADPGPSSLVVDTSGRLYGVTTYGGLSGDHGTVFRLTPRANRKTWTHETLYDFCYRTDNCRDGAWPVGGLTYSGASSGVPYDGTSPLYGVTSYGGFRFGGVVYALAVAGSRWKQTVLYQFCSVKPPSCLDGKGPNAVPTLDRDGNLYGPTGFGGLVTTGVIYKLSPGIGHHWTETVLHNVCRGGVCPGGSGEISALVVDDGGNLYGTASAGGGSDHGTLFKLSPAGEMTSLHDFCSEADCADGSGPSNLGGLVLDGSGNLFGTASSGGNSRNGGVAFEYSGTSFSTLFAFCDIVNCSDGVSPYGGLIQDPSGALWGTTIGGGSWHEGTAFKLEP